MDQSRILIIGANGQLGKALQARYTQAVAVDRAEFDMTNPAVVGGYDWSGVDIILNAAAYTNVDAAETAEGRAAAWLVNAQAPAYLSQVASQYDITLVHISTDYVFDGSQQSHSESEGFAPLGVYGQSKAAGDIAISLTPKHYILRTSWVMGDGGNFVRSIMGLAAKDISPKVVGDQYGRPTFTSELVEAIAFLLENSAPVGTYNLSNGGDVVSWADIARQVYQDLGRGDLTVSDTTAAEYFAGKVSSPRPVNSDLDLSKIEQLGFQPTDWRDDLKIYVKENA